MIEEIVNKQREYFYSGATMPLEVRKANLRKIKDLLIKYQDKFYEAFELDYNKGKFDVLSTEILLVLDEIEYHIKHLNKEAKPKKVKTSLFNFPSKGYLLNEPYGVTLIMAPWNYPLQLALEPLIGSIASGNTAILKPASYAKNVSQVIYDMFNEFGNQSLIAVVLGGREENQALLEQHFDYIFFTGGDAVGRVVLEKAAKWLTPVSLELGGKSPTIVDKDADINLAAKRITWGKFLNAGQTCVAPDFILVHKDVKDAYINKVKEYIQKFYYQNGVLTSTFPHIINDKHAERLKGLIDEKKLVCGGKVEGRLIEPTVLDNVTFDDPVMQEEIFGPIMPIIPFTNLDEVIKILQRREKPLAFYYFTKDKKKGKRVLNEVAYGGGCLNETIMHLTNSSLPFGGVGRSGMGSYHGKKSFETFSHQKSVLVKGKKELNTKYPPYTEKNFKLVKFISKTNTKNK